MKFIDKSKVPTPSILKTKGKDATNANFRRYLASIASGGTPKFEFDNDIYAHGDVKNALLKLQGYYCCYCECPTSVGGYPEVEHYRPKGLYNNFKGDTFKLGYFWLAYSWSNLIYTCKRCNTSHKRSYFPISDEATRAHINGFSTKGEEPDILHPCVDNPDEHLTFHKEMITHKTERGRKTIEILGLDRDILDADRREKYGDIETMIDMCDLVKGTGQEAGLKGKVIEKLKTKTLYGPYTMMYKSILDKLID